MKDSRIDHCKGEITSGGVDTAVTTVETGNVSVAENESAMSITPVQLT